MASNEEALTGFRWFAQHTLQTAKDAVRLYFEPVIWIVNLFRGLAKLADRALHERHTEGEDSLDVTAERAHDVMVVSTRDVEELLESNREAERNLREAVSNLNPDDAVALRLENSLRVVLAERTVILKWRPPGNQQVTSHLTSPNYRVD